MKLKRLIRLASVCLVLIEMSAFGQGALDDWADRMQRSRPEVPATSREWAKKFAKTLSKANADAFAEDRAIAEASLPFPLPDDACWTRLETPEAEYLSECVFSSPDGFACRFAVYGQYGCKRAYYWTGVRVDTSADGVALTYDQGTNFVAAVLSRKELPVDVRGVRDVLVSTETEITVRGDVVDCPFDRFRFILADDRPGANWAHPCRFVFIAEDGRSFAVSYESWKPQIRRKTDGKRLWLLPGFHTARQVGLDEVKNSVYSSVPNGTGPGAAFYAGDVSHSYFVLISGGANAELNGIRFWADTAFMYSTLTKKYGVASDHIHVLMSDGLDPSADACLGETTEGEPVLVSSPTDLDGDGTVDVDRTASWNNLCEVFNGLKSTLTAQDQLFVFVTSHGNSRGTAGESNHDCRASLYSPTGDQYDEDRNYANFTDENLQSLTKDIKCPIAFAFETCYSGGFIDDLTATANRMVATACNHYETSWGTGMTVSGPWTGTGIGKTRSHNRWARPFTSALRGCLPSNMTTSTYPWSDGTACADAADANGDGKVCFSEAAAYAHANDAKVCTRTTHSPTLCKDYEHPQYGESPTGLGAALLLLKQDATPVIRPANDDFANATAITGASGSLTASSANATKETGEPYHGTSSATNSVWWKWTATAAGSMTITTEGSDFDTGLGVYTGSSVSALTKVASNDDVATGTTWSSVTFSAVAGLTYYIAVAGYNGATGAVRLDWSFTGTPSAYSITYALNGGTHGTAHPSSATYGSAFCVSAPTRSGYAFAGWTVTSGLNASTAKWGTSASPSAAISSSSTKCVNGATGNVYFKNLTPTANGSVTLTANWTAPVALYVAAGGSDAQSGDEGAPLATIQAAIDRAPENSVILVGPGVYAPISTEGKRIAIRGVDGPGLTVIDGGWTNRCAHLGTTTNTVLENLTLRNGVAGCWSPYEGYVRLKEDGGGAYGGTLVNCHVVGNKALNGGGCCNTILRNCKVSGNAATQYGGGAYCRDSLRNCVVAEGCCFFDNTVGVIERYGFAAGSALYADFASGLKVRNCIVAGNECGRFGDGGAVASDYGDTDCALQNCTVVNNRGGMTGGNRAAGVYGFSLINSIIRFNRDEYGSESDIPEYVSRLVTISGCCVSALPDFGYTGSGNTTEDPKFVDLARHVYRLQAGSPCLNTGVSVSDAGVTDALGRARIAESRIDMGACEGVALGSVVTCEVVGDGLVLEPGDVLAPNESTVFTAVETRRRFVNFTASNGATTTDKVIRLSNVASDTTVVAAFERLTFYVDASRPDDLGDGQSWGTAKKTIASALALCARNDEVIVADGTYGAFVVMVEGVTVRSVNGPDRTVIDADGKSRCVDFSTPDGAEIVAFLEGFTLCNGQTASAGGGAYGGVLKRCVVRDNVAGTAGGGLYGSRAENTIIVRNSAETFGGGAAYATLVNCSVAGNRMHGGSGGGLYLGQAVNTVVWGNEANGRTDEYSGGSFTNCVTTPLPTGSGNRNVDPRLVDAVNGDVRLRTGSPLKDAGNPLFVAGTFDVFGNARLQGAKVDVGAIEGGEVAGHVVSVRVKGAGDVSPRTAVVSDGGSVTLTAVEALRPFSHYLLQGLKVTGREQRLADLKSDLTVTAVFTPYTFYVDAAAKTSGDGLSRATAKRTIQEAVDVAETDEIVRVAPGVYPPISTHNKRVVIESERGPSVTVIDGGQTNRCATLADNSSGRATVLRGFTLTHGVLKGTDLYGGGAYAGTLDRCIVSNCQLLGTSPSSSSWGQGAGVAYSKAVNTLIVNNIASNYMSYAGTYLADLRNCTVTGNRAVSGTWQYGGTYYGTADNCIIWGNEGGDRNNSYGTALKYCCVDSSSTIRGTGCVVADPQFVDAASGDYRLAMDSPCIGAGLLGDADVGEVDLDGLARVVNGTIDIGAYEWQNGVVIPRSSEAAVVIPLDWFTSGKIDGLSVFSPSHFAALFGTDSAAAAKKPTGKVDAHGNPMYVWQDFIAGTDPTDKTSEFKASISIVDGKPVVSWTPDLNEGGAKSLRTYRTLGINDLAQSADPAAWREVTPGSESAYKFFKVEVDMK